MSTFRTRLLPIAAIVAAGVAFLAGGTGTGHAQSPIANHSFETGDLTGWVVVAASGSINVVPGAATSDSGQFMAVLTGSHLSGSWLKQEFYLAAGETVSGWWAYRAGSVGECAEGWAHAGMLQFGPDYYHELFNTTSCTGDVAFTDWTFVAPQNDLYTLWAWIGGGLPANPLGPPNQLMLDASIETPRWHGTLKDGPNDWANPYRPGTWSRNPVALHLSCLAGDAGYPVKSVSGDTDFLFRDGVHEFSTSNQACVDEAGLSAPRFSVDGQIMVDTTAPDCAVTPGDVFLPRGTTGADVRFELSYSDATSGVAAVVESHSANGGAIVNRVGGPDGTQFNVTLPGSTARIDISWTITDVAGNVAACQASIRTQ